MQPQTPTQPKSIMDVSAPPKPAVLPVPVLPPASASAPVASHDSSIPLSPAPPHVAPVVQQTEAAQLAVQQAPIDTTDAGAGDTPAINESKPVPVPAKPKQEGPGAPVGVIVVTIIFMLISSSIAVAIYMAS